MLCAPEELETQGVNMTERQEQETIINWNEEDELVSIYTASPVVMRRCKKLFRLVKVDTLKKTGEECSWWFECEKGCVLLRKQRKPIQLSQERKAHLAAQMDKIRKSKTAIRAI